MKGYQWEFPDLSFVTFDSDTSLAPFFIHREFLHSKFFSDTPKLSGTVLDFGANVGYISFYLAKKFPGIQIHAYEPFPENYGYLLHGIHFNKLQNVTPQRMAVSCGEAELPLAWDDTNSGSPTVYLAGDRRIMVPARNINDVVAEHERVDLLKLDVEGMEFSLLRDFQHWDRVNYLCLEIHPWCFFEHFDEQVKVALKFKEFVESKINPSKLFLETSDPKIAKAVGLKGE